MTDVLNQTLMMIVRVAIFQTEIDRVLCHSSFIPRSSSSFFRGAFTIYETYSHRNGMCKCLCCSHLDRKYLRGIT